MDILQETNFSFLGPKKTGKVRDMYERGGNLVLITTDRHSSFDRIIAHIPWKGQVLNQLSAWWFDKTKDIVPNAVLAIPDPNVTIARKCTMVPIEAVVRGYLTGVTDTAAWTRYAAGTRDFGGTILPAGMRKNQELPRPIFDPTTKEATHDRTLSPHQMIAEGFITQNLFDRVKGTALKLFARGQEIAAHSDLILVDTKYEFGTDEHGALILIDEIHTPDLSRFWQRDFTPRASAQVRSLNISTRNFYGCGFATIATLTAMPHCQQPRRDWLMSCRAATSPCTIRSRARNFSAARRRSCSESRRI